MKAVRLLEYALTKEPYKVLDVGCGKGEHVKTFLGEGCKVAGLDVTEAPLEHEFYDHIKSTYENVDMGGRQFDMIWCCHTLEHIPNVQHFLITLWNWLADDGYLAITVPTDRQGRIHIGHATLWTPALLIYNLITAGWDCREAKWYTEYRSIGLIVQKTELVDNRGHTGMPDEVYWLNKYTPVVLQTGNAAWLQNNWHEDTEQRIPDPPAITIGAVETDLPPLYPSSFGPNPKFRKPPYGEA